MVLVVCVAHFKSTNPVHELCELLLQAGFTIRCIAHSQVVDVTIAPDRLLNFLARPASNFPCFYAPLIQLMSLLASFQALLIRALIMIIRNRSRSQFATSSRINPSKFTIIPRIFIVRKQIKNRIKDNFISYKKLLLTFFFIKLKFKQISIKKRAQAQSHPYFIHPQICPPLETMRASNYFHTFIKKYNSI